MQHRLWAPFSHRIFFELIKGSTALGLLMVIFPYAIRFEFEAIGRICIPLLVVFFGFTSLLFNRARAFSKGRSRVRCMYAAERSLQATMFAFLGLLLGTGMYALFVIFGFAPNQALEVKHAWLLLFILPHLLIQTSVVCFLLAFRTIAIEFLGPLSPRTIRQRLKDGL